MQRETFYEHLVRATACSFDCAKRFVSNKLPDSICYLVYLNASHAGNPLEPGEFTFPDDVARSGACVGPLTTTQVVELLWREGRVPEWVDVSVERTDGVKTFVQLLC